MSDVSLIPGALVTPSIRLVRVLGRGGMGSVWVADHLRLHTQVVVKFVASEYAAHAEVLARFEREAALAAQAKSPHVVQILDYGKTEAGIPFIAMEMLEGEDLGKRLERERAIAPHVYADWLVQACKGLSRAHAKGIVHRDIKPENIFLSQVDEDIVVKVLDFGIAKATGGPGAFAGTKTGAFLGTAYYMSPEQTMGAKDIDHRVDLWALGVVTYFALTGTRPFDGDAIGALVIAITASPIVPPSARNPALPPSIDAWMAKALARAPAERFSSAKEMADAFVAAVGDTRAVTRLVTPALPQPKFSTTAGAVSIREAELTEVPGKRASRAPLFAALAVLCLGGVGTAAFFALRGHDHEPPPAAAAPKPTVESQPTIAPAAVETATPPPPQKVEEAASTPPPVASSAAPRVVQLPAGKLPAKTPDKIAPTASVVAVAPPPPPPPPPSAAPSAKPKKSPLQMGLE